MAVDSVSALNSVSDSKQLDLKKLAIHCITGGTVESSQKLDGLLLDCKVSI
jgi:hypothetical protein